MVNNITYEIYSNNHLMYKNIKTIKEARSITKRLYLSKIIEVSKKEVV